MSHHLDHLLQVVPIAQTHTSIGVSITLFSLERFTEGMRLRGRVTADDERLAWAHVEMVAPFAIPTMDFRATDDRGGQYRLRGEGASGTPRRLEFSAISAKPLSILTNQLQLELSEIRWLDPGRTSSDRIIHTQSVTWTLSVPILTTI